MPRHSSRIHDLLGQLHIILASSELAITCLTHQELVEHMERVQKAVKKAEELLQNCDIVERQ